MGGRQRTATRRPPSPLTTTIAHVLASKPWSGEPHAPPPPPPACVIARSRFIGHVHMHRCVFRCQSVGDCRDAAGDGCLAVDASSTSSLARSYRGSVS